MVAVIGLFGYYAHANPTFFPTPSQTASATSSAAYMTPGNGTSTLVYDSYQITQGSNISFNQTGISGLALGVQLTATTGFPTLNIEYEYSQGVTGKDCVATPAACDWYRNSPISEATTTNPVRVNEVGITQFYFASTTAMEGGNAYDAGDTTINLSFDVKPRMRYVRAVAYLSSTTAIVSNSRDNGMVWMEWIPKKEESR